jgi:hypothetical protein
VEGCPALSHDRFGSSKLLDLGAIPGDARRGGYPSHRGSRTDAT